MRAPERAVTDETFVYTLSGHRATLLAPPPIEDFVTSVARLPRFSGNTKQFWTVLSHEIVGTYIMQWLMVRAMHAFALHDSCESMFGDIPTPYKTAENFENENRVLAVLYKDSYVMATEDVLQAVDSVDRICLVAESFAFLHEDAVEFFSNTFAANLTEEQDWLLEPAQDIVGRLAKLQKAKPSLWVDGRESPLILAYEELLEVMKEEPAHDHVSAFQSFLRTLYFLGMEPDDRDFDGWTDG